MGGLNIFLIYVLVYGVSCFLVTVGEVRRQGGVAGL